MSRRKLDANLRTCLLLAGLAALIYTLLYLSTI